MMRLTTLCAALVIATPLIACGNTVVATQVIVIIDAEPGVRAQTEKLHIVVQGMAGKNESAEREPYDRTVTKKSGDLKWPYLVALEPFGGDAARPYEVVVTALDTSGKFVTQVRAISGYVNHKRLALRLLLEDSCIGNQKCSSDQTCRDGACENARIRAADLRNFTGNSDTAGSTGGGGRDSDRGDAGPGGQDLDASTITTDSGSGGTDGGGPSGAGGRMSSDPCDADNGGCDALVTCLSDAAKVTCGACPDGYDDTNGDGTICTDVDECATNNGGCGDAAFWLCGNETGAAPTCTDVTPCTVGNACPDDANPCTTDTCNASGTCVHPAGNVGTICRALSGGCDIADTCTGSATACPSDAVRMSGTVCRGQSNICDAAETCNGASAACPTDSFAPINTDCGYTGGANALTIYATGAVLTGTNANVQDFATSPTSGYTNSLTNPAAAAMVAPAVVPGWGSDAIKFTVTAPATASVDYWRWIAGNGAAFGSSRALQAADYIEYDVYLDANIDGIGGIDIKTNHSDTAISGVCAGSCSYFRDWVGWADQNSVGGNPATNLVSPNRAHQKWYHRRLAVPAGLVGNTITYFDVVDEHDTNAPVATRSAYYDNLIISQTPGGCSGVAATCLVKGGGACTTSAQCTSGNCSANVCSP